MPPAREQGRGGARGQFPKHGRKTVKANTMADLSRRSPLGTLPANRLLAPGAHNLEIPLARYGLARLRDQLFGSGAEHAGDEDQLATPLDGDIMTDRTRC